MTTNANVPKLATLHNQLDFSLANSCLDNIQQISCEPFERFVKILGN